MAAVIDGSNTEQLSVYKLWRGEEWQVYQLWRADASRYMKSRPTELPNPPSKGVRGKALLACLGIPRTAPH